MSGSAEFIVRLVDQLTGPARRMVSSLLGLGDAARRVGQGAEGIRKIVVNMKDMAAASTEAKKRMDALHAASQRVVSGAKQFGRGAFTAGMLGMTYQATKYGAALGFVKSQLLSTQIEFENYFATLETMSRDKGKAQRLMNWASDFAVKTPYELPQVVEALAKLSAYGVIDPKKVDDRVGKIRIDRTMTALGDASSSLGKGYLQGVEAIADAMTGQFERLKEAYGIIGSKKGDKVTLEYLDLIDNKTKKTTLDLKNREKIVYEIVKMLERNYGGGMVRKSQTTGGMLSNYADAWTRFKQQIISSGLGDEINRQLKSGLDWLEEMNKPFKVKGPDNMWETHTKLGDLAASISGMLMNRLREVIDLAKKLYEQLKKIADLGDQFANSPMGKAMGGWAGILTGLLAIPFVKPVFDMAKGLVDMAAGFALAAFNGVMLWKVLKAVKSIGPVAPGGAAGAAGAAAGAGSGGVAPVVAGGARFPWFRALGNLGIMAWIASKMPSGTPEEVAKQIGENWKGSEDLDATIRGWLPEWLQKRLTPEAEMPGGSGYQPPEPAKPQEMAADLRAQIAELQARVDQIRSRSKMPEMADSLAGPLEAQINELRARLRVYEEDAARTGAAVKTNLDVTASPTIDTSGMDAAIAKAREFRGYMDQIGPVSPNGGGGGGGGAGAAGPRAAGHASITVNVNGGRDGNAIGRKVAAAVREAIDRTYGDGAYRPSMVG